MCFRKNELRIEIDPKNIHLFVLEEYRALRAEIIQTMNNRNTILTFSFASIAGFITASSLVYKEEPFISYIIVTFVISPIITLFFILWISETRSIIRIAKYIKEEIENKAVGCYTQKEKKDISNDINNKDNYLKLIKWENWLTSKEITSWEDKSLPVTLFICFFQLNSWWLGENFLKIQAYPEKLNSIISKDRMLSLSRLTIGLCILIELFYYVWVKYRGSQLRK